MNPAIMLLENGYYTEYSYVVDGVEYATYDEAAEALGVFRDSTAAN